MGSTSAWLGAGAGQLPRTLCVLLLSCAPAFGAGTNQVAVSVLPFVNLSGQTNLDVWRRVFPESLSFDLREGKPPRVKVYYNKVLTELTSQSKRRSAGRGMQTGRAGARVV
jgi:hypothetical protein